MIPYVKMSTSTLGENMLTMNAVPDIIPPAIVTCRQEYFSKSMLTNGPVIKKQNARVDDY